MAHFAKLDENNIVLEIVVVNNDVITVDGVESEQAGIDFLKDIYGHANWKQASYNGNIRKHFPGIGWRYESEFNAFIPWQPFPSWKLNYTTFHWDPPTPAPADGDTYIWKWSEPNKEWIKVNLPE
jgi:hypothetical protein